MIPVQNPPERAAKMDDPRFHRLEAKVDEIGQVLVTLARIEERLTTCDSKNISRPNTLIERRRPNHNHRSVQVQRRSELVGCLYPFTGRACDPRNGRVDGSFLSLG